MKGRWGLKRRPERVPKGLLCHPGQSELHTLQPTVWRTDCGRQRRGGGSQGRNWVVLNRGGEKRDEAWEWNRCEMKGHLAWPTFQDRGGDAMNWRGSVGGTFGMGTQGRYSLGRSSLRQWETWTFDSDLASQLKRFQTESFLGRECIPWFFSLDFLNLWFPRCSFLDSYESSLHNPFGFLDSLV